MPNSPTSQSETANAISAEKQFIRVIGVTALTASIINNTVGAYIFRLPADAAKEMGAAAPLGYLVCTLMMGFILSSFAMAASRVSLTGGPYAYVEVAFGPYAGFVSGLLLYCGNVFGVAAVANMLIETIGVFLPFSKAPWIRPILTALLFAAIAWPNYRGAKPGTRLIQTVTLGKLLPLLLFVVIGITAVVPANLAWPSGSATSNLGSGVNVLLFAFTGAELAIVPGGEVRNPRRTVPLALGFGLLIVAVLYLAIQLVSQGVLGDTLARSKTPVAEAMKVILGPSGTVLILSGTMISTFGLLCGDMLSSPRILFAFARDHRLPAALASIHPRFKTPHLAIATHATIMMAVGNIRGFKWLADQSVSATLLLYLLCCLAAWRLLIKEDGTTQSWIARGKSIVPWIACAFILWSLWSQATATRIVAGAVIVLATALYFLGKWRGLSQRTTAGGAML